MLWHKVKDNLYYRPVASCAVLLLARAPEHCAGAAVERNCLRLAESLSALDRYALPRQESIRLFKHVTY